MNSVIIIPAYNPDEKLKQIVDQMWNCGNTIIVVDDGSDEDKKNLFEEIVEKSIVIHHQTNHGKGAAIKTALVFCILSLIHCINILYHKIGKRKRLDTRYTKRYKK